MRRKLLGIIICILFVTMTLQITGSATFDVEENSEMLDENEKSVLTLPITEPPNVVFGDDPEIVDNLEDSVGRLAWLPSNFYAHINIESTWFFEDAQNPHYLYITIKIKDLDYKSLRAIYSVHWEYNRQDYAAGSHVHSKGKYQVFYVSYERGSIQAECSATFNETADTIIWEIPKSAIGNPKKGDVLTKSYTWTALRFRHELLTLVFFSGELVKDAAPFLEGVEDYGNDYTIKY